MRFAQSKRLFLRCSVAGPRRIQPLGAGKFFVQSTGSIFLLAVQIAAPLMAINFVVTLTFAILSKAAPGVNAFAESFPVRIAAGLTLLALALGLTAQLVLSGLHQAPELMLRLIP